MFHFFKIINLMNNKKAYNIYDFLDLTNFDYAKKIFIAHNSIGIFKSLLMALKLSKRQENEQS